MTAFDLLAATIFADPHLSVAASYLAPGDGAEAVAVKVVPDGGDALFRLGVADLPGLSAAFRVRAAELTAPAPGGVLTVGGVAWTVIAPPVADSRGLVWTLGVQRR